MDYHQLIKSAFICADSAFKSTKNGEEIHSIGSGFGDLVDDTEIEMDLSIGRELQTFFQVNCDDVNPHISVEGFDDILGAKDSSIWICIDPLDGSLNYRFRNGALGLPFSCCITILRKKKNATFSDIIAAGVMDYRNGDQWISIKDDVRFVTFFRDNKIVLDGWAKLDIRNGILIAEMYYPENRNLVLEMFANEKGWIRNPGSAAYEMALVANGSVLAFICDRQKLHELGAGYALVKGVGGVAVDFFGQDLADYPYVFNSQLPVIIAVNNIIANELLNRIFKVRG